MTTSPLSRNQIRQAGRCLKKFARGEVGNEEREQALKTIQQHRDRFLTPMGEVQSTLHAIVYLLFEGLAVQPVARLKQISTIEEKIKREENLALSNMQDIGGCRVVVEEVEDCYLVLEKVLDEWPGSKVNDYVAEPRVSGYRAVHAIVRQGTLPIEIQIRSRTHHEWAETVEQFSKIFKKNLKFDGNDPIQLMMKLQADIGEMRRQGNEPHPDDIARWSRLQSEVLLQLRSNLSVGTSQLQTGPSHE